MTPRGIAFWGLGRHAIAKLLPAAAATTGLRLVGVCSRNSAQVAATAAHWQCQGWTDPAEMFADEGVEIVYVATPIALHAEHTQRVLEAGKHVWCEKPITADLTTATALIDLARSQSRSLLEGFMYLHHPHFHGLRALVTGGRLGTPVSMTSRFGLPRLDAPGFRLDPALGGGGLLDVGCYPVSLMVGLMGASPYRVQSASVATRGGWMVDTDGYALVECANGVTAHLEWRINSSYRNDVDVWGDRGAVFTERIFSKPSDFVPEYRVRDGKGVEQRESGAPGDHFALMFRDFRKIIEDGSAVETGYRDVALRAALLEDIRVCADSNRLRKA